MADASGLEPAVVFKNKYHVTGIFRARLAGKAQCHQVKDAVAIRIADAFDAVSWDDDSAAASVSSVACDFVAPEPSQPTKTAASKDAGIRETVNKATILFLIDCPLLDLSGRDLFSAFSFESAKGLY